jgi:hypothetical protein
MKELQIPQAKELIEQYRRNCKEHIDRMNSDGNILFYDICNMYQ